MTLEAIGHLELSKVRCFTLILTCLLLIVTCQARTITVDDDGPADFNTIQAAIDDANHGDVILVKPGNYSGDGNHDIHLRSKAVTVRSEKGPDVTVIDCADNDYGFGIEDNNVAETRLEGLTIRNAAYGAIRCYSSVLPRSAMASDGTQTDVAVLYNPGYADVVIADCVITANQTIGIVCDGHNNVTISNCNISRNAGQGVYSYMSWPTIKNCLVAKNGKTGVRATRATIVNCTIVANQFDGVWAREPNVTNSIIWGNSGEQIRDLNGNSVVTYSDVQSGWKGRGNIDSEPLFADTDSNDYHLLRRSPCVDAGDPNYSYDDFWVDGDYHLKSQAGRWDPTSATWIRDDLTSPCVDAGDPMSPIGQEPFPNGGIVNMGAYGGTAEASKSHFGQPPCETIVAGDINGDCRIDFLDFVIMSNHWLEDHRGR